MGREARTLLLLAVFAVGAVAVLGSMAKRYGTMLEERRGGGERVAAAAAIRIDASTEAVETFTAIRSAMHVALEQRLTSTTPEEALRRARERELTEREVDPARYEAVRDAYRSWRIGAPIDDSLRTAFDAEAAALRASDLGPYESLDR